MIRAEFRKITRDTEVPEQVTDTVTISRHEGAEQEWLLKPEDRELWQQSPNGTVAFSGETISLKDPWKGIGK